jgi:colanic acid biosynthesis glycosyl transferase WcaI
MRILVLTVNYWPEETGIGAVTTWRCEGLAARGHDVSVCTTFPYYPQWRVADDYRGKSWLSESRNGVTIYRSWSWVPSRLSSVKRILFEASFLAGNLLRALSAEKPELIVVESPPLGLALTARLLGRHWKVPFVFDVMDLQPDAAAELGMLSSGPLMRALYWLERYAYTHAALISTLTEGMRQRIIGKFISPRKVALIATHADSDLLSIRRDELGQRFRKMHGLDGKFIVVHSGNMGVKQGLEVILDAAELSLDRPEIVYLIVGDGAMRSELQSKAASAGLDNVWFLPVLARQQFLEMLAATDIALITQQRSVSDIVFPSKTATLMSAGCPIVASVNESCEVARVLEHSGAGLVMPAENPLALFDAIRAVQSNPQRRRGMGEAGRSYARLHWDENVVLAKLESELFRAAGWMPRHLANAQVHGANV